MGNEKKSAAVAPQNPNEKMLDTIMNTADSTEWVELNSLPYFKFGEIGNGETIAAIFLRAEETPNYNDSNITDYTPVIGVKKDGAYAECYCKDAVIVSAFKKLGFATGVDQDPKPAKIYKRGMKKSPNGEYADLQIFTL